MSTDELVWSYDDEGDLYLDVGPLRLICKETMEGYMALLIGVDDEIDHENGHCCECSAKRAAVNMAVGYLSELLKDAKSIPYASKPNDVP